ncbi:MAG: hypothetical protein IIA45_08455, partial [Bacteroidetes bacterium]|nr:hypothetical protein [Bacteroidota bacterium]
MKQLFVALLVILLPMSVLAQHVKKNLKARPNSYFLLEESAPFKRTVVFAEPAKVNAPESGSSAVTSVALGSAGNILTIVASESNMLISDNKLNTVVFIHRNND